ncbi:MAG TPA: glycerate kinase [Acidimicrobiales bacterium]|nr:glycerate kinase [Acidimicrobiales bacterium]
MTAAPSSPPGVLAAPDAFKGTAGAPVIAEAIAAAAARAGWRCDLCPLSDGGEGFADVLAAGPGTARTGGRPRGRSFGRPGEWRRALVTGPLARPVTARWWMAGGDAVIESAAASGLPLAGGAEGNDPLGATTRGTGELVVAALAAGARRVLIGVGGSATTDGGLGAIEAIEQAGGLGGAEVVVACDVAARFVEAAEGFGPQKGATPAQVVELRHRLEALAGTLRDRYGVDVRALPGSGAAGGLAGGLAALGARLVPGFDLVADTVGLAARLARADVVVTGEGRLDGSSWSGKVVGGVVRAAARVGVPVLVVAGAVGPGGVEGVSSAASGPSVAGPASGGTTSGGTTSGGTTSGGTVVEVVSLTDRCGPARSLADPAGCVDEVVGAALAERRGPPLTIK